MTTIKIASDTQVAVAHFGSAISSLPYDLPLEGILATAKAYRPDVVVFNEPYCIPVIPKADVDHSNLLRGFRWRRNFIAARLLVGR